MNWLNSKGADIPEEIYEHIEEELTFWSQHQSLAVGEKLWFSNMSLLILNKSYKSIGNGRILQFNGILETYI